MNLFGLRVVNLGLRLAHLGRDLPPLAKANLRVLSTARSALPIQDCNYVVVDLETTGLDPDTDRVVSVGAFRVSKGRVRLGDHFSELCNPGRDIPPDSIKVHAIKPDMITCARPAWEVFEDFLQYVGNDILVAHYARFDLFFMNWVMRERYGFRMQNLVLDTVLMCRQALIEPDPYGIRKGAKRCSLDALADRYGIYLPERHTALGDALATALILQRLLPELVKGGWTTLGDLVRVAGVW